MKTLILIMSVTKSQISSIRFYPVDGVKNGLCCSTTRSKGFQAGRGLAQVHGCHEYSKKYLKMQYPSGQTVRNVIQNSRCWTNWIQRTWMRLPGDSSLVSMTNLDPYQKASAKHKKMMNHRYPWKTPIMVPFFTPQLWASARFRSYLCKIHILI